MTEQNDSMEHWLEANVPELIDYSRWLLSYFIYKHVHVPFVKNRANIYRSNFSATEDLLQLPFSLAALPEAKKVFAKAVEPTEVLLKSIGPALPEIMRILDELNSRSPDEVKAWLLNEKNVASMEKLISPDLKAVLGSFLDLLFIYLDFGGKSGKESMKDAIRPAIEMSEEVIDSFNDLFRTNLCSIWTNLEVLASDLWEDIVNLSPDRLVPAAMRQDRQIDTPGLSQRQVSVELLAKFGFDLRNSMGTLLRPKFDFSSVEGIEKAYTILGTKLWDAEQRKNLYLLEQTRHLIQHRAGVVDRKFQECTKLQCEIGSKFQVNLVDLTAYKNLANEAAMKLMVVTMQWYQNQYPNPEET